MAVVDDDRLVGGVISMMRIGANERRRKRDRINILC